MRVSDVGTVCIGDTGTHLRMHVSDMGTEGYKMNCLRYITSE